MHLTRRDSKKAPLAERCFTRALPAYRSNHRSFTWASTSPDTLVSVRWRAPTESLGLTSMLRYLLDLYIGLCMEHNLQNPVLSFAVLYSLSDAERLQTHARSQS